ncbi:MAG: hypothetical protein HY652_05430 [Acidobacteria bacterium]|nr:hypothetical protein [Acidobacteriota bacterium]
MDSAMKEVLINVTRALVGYLPNLFVGLVLIAIGWLMAWVVKRVVVQLSRILRVDRFFRRFGWREGLAKADVRYALYNFFGSIAFVVVFAIFLIDALRAMKLAMVSSLLEKGVFFLPSLIASLIIFGVGWLISWRAALAMQRILMREEIPRPTLIARFIQVLLLLFFSAMALVELSIAREIVIIGFTTAFLTIGVLTIVLTARGGKAFVAALSRSREEE